MLLSSLLDPELDSLDYNPVAVPVTAKAGMQKAKGGQTLQASWVEASLQLKRGPEEGRKQVKNTLAAEVDPMDQQQISG